MGAAIASFPGVAAILIPRTRFAPVKTTNDMLALMSDAYEVTEDHRMLLKGVRNGVPPTVKLGAEYKFVDQLNTLIPKGPPSLIKCDKLTVEGAVYFAKGVIFEGEVKVVNAGAKAAKLAAGTYKDQTVTVEARSSSMLSLS